MDNLWFDYERQHVRAGHQFEDEHPEVVPRTRLQEIWAWEDYAIQQYMKWVSLPAEAQIVSEARYGN